MRKIKVLIVAGAMNSGGQENQLMHIIRNADKSKFQIDFTSTLPNAYYRSEIEKLGGRYYHIPSFNYKRPSAYCKALYGIMKDGGYDVVHSNELFHSGIVVKIAKKAGVNCRISHSHSGRDGDGKNAVIQKIYHIVMQGWINRYSTSLIACSSIAGEFLFGKKAVGRNNYHLVYNSVDTEKFINDNADDTQLELFNNEYKSILHPAHIVPLKNQELLIEIAKELKSRNSKIHIYCAGAGEQSYIDLLNERIKEYEIEDYISLIGLRSDIDVLMKKADAFTLPSRFEGMPLSLIEAQTAGLPCVVADTFSHEVDFKIGLIDWLKIDDGVKKWADAFEKAVIKPKAGREEIVNAVNEYGFDSKLYANKICGIYRNEYEHTK